jgi:hypothetical protein
MKKTHTPKPKTARILFKIRSRHPLSVFSTTVAFPYLHQEQWWPKKKERRIMNPKNKKTNKTWIKSLEWKNLTTSKHKNKPVFLGYISMHHLHYSNPGFGLIKSNSYLQSPSKFIQPTYLPLNYPYHPTSYQSSTIHKTILLKAKQPLTMQKSGRKNYKQSIQFSNFRLLINSPSQQFKSIQ